MHAAAIERMGLEGFEPGDVGLERFFERGDESCARRMWKIARKAADPLLNALELAKPSIYRDPAEQPVSSSGHSSA